MFQILGGILLLGAIDAIFNKKSPEMERLEAASKGVIGSIDELADAYWKLYSATYRPKSQWILLSREEKSAVYKMREDLRALFDQFPQKAQRAIMAKRPARPRP